MSTDYDLLVIGAGPGGYPAAIRGAQLGLKTACVEKELLGGVCLNWGCIPSKALLKTAEFANKIRHSEDFGLTTGELGIDFEKVVARSRKVSTRFNRGVKSLFKKYGVTNISGTATLVAPGQVKITSSKGEQTLTAKHIVIATGARARVFPGMEPDGTHILTYREAIVRDAKPASLIVLGAGAIGMEFAYFMNAMGVEVTVVEGQPQILPLEDAETAAVVEKSFKKSGITFHTGAFVDTVAREGDGCVVTLKDGQSLKAEVVLLALGVTPNSDNVGLDNVGINTDGRGFITVDKNHQTNVPGIYAVGDVCSVGPALAHTATRQAHVVVERIAGLHVPDIDYTAMPSATYCQPQIASVGYTEKAARAEGLEFSVGKFPFLANGRMQGAGTPDGFVKVLVGKKYGEILGAHIVGADATEMITEFVLARNNELDAESLLETVHAHPTASEAMLEAVADAMGVSVHM